MAGNTNFPTLLLSSTLAKYRKTFVDNVFDKSPLLDYLKRRDNIRMVDGGEKIVEQLMYADNSTFGTYSGYDTLDITPQEGFTAAEYPWKQAAVSIAISGIERAKNAGEAKLFDMLKAKIKQAEMTMGDELNTMLYLDGTGNAGKNLLGLAALVGNETGTAIVGNIDCTAVDNAWWRSVVVNAAADGSAVRDDDEWANAYYTASMNGGDYPDFAITTQTLFEHYEASLVSQLRFTSNEKADSRFKSLEFKGIPLFFDNSCQSGVTYFLNSEYIQLVAHKDVWFKQTDFKDAPDKDAIWAQILTYANMTCSNRRKQAKVINQTVV